MRLVHGRTRAAVLLTSVVLVVLVVSATATTGQASTVSSGRPTTTTSGPRGKGTGTGTTWLCRPGLANNPCTANLDSTAVAADGSTSVTPGAPATASTFDCFYVYPTVSQEQAVNADLQVQPAETNMATMQASRFSQLCQVWAPMYRQTTLGTLMKEGFPLDSKTVNVSYQSLLAGWRDYLAHYNHGRPIVFISHSQGSALMMTLLRSEVDGNSKLRRQVVSAILPGGNVEVPTVAGGGGTFKHFPACRSTGQVGCVIAYSTFPGQPPADSAVGRPGQGVSKGQKGQSPTTTQVLCVNPAALGGGTAGLDSFFLTSAMPTPGVDVTTPWVEYPGRYSATCLTDGDATWLNAGAAPGDTRPLVAVKSPQWGYHPDDVNLALGDLVRDVQAQETAYSAASR